MYRDIDKVFAGKLGFYPRSSHTKDLKMVLDAALRNARHYKVWIEGKWTTVANFTLIIYASIYIHMHT